jgi:hypothetical protein
MPYPVSANGERLECMADWSLLRRALSQVDQSVHFTWHELDALVGGLPASATNHRAWWSGDRSHVNAWRSAGFTVANLVPGREVTFVRIPTRPKAAADPAIRVPAAAPPAERPAPGPVRSGPPPPPIDSSRYSGDAIRQSEALTRARFDLPYPVARAARAVQTTQDPLEQYQYLLDLGEALTVTLGVLSASWLRQHAPLDASLQMLHGSYHLRGVSQGHWHQVTKAAEKAMAASRKEFPGFVQAVRSRRNDVGAVDALKLVLAERNRASHGARPHNRAEAAVRIAELAPSAVQAVDRSGFLREASWVLIESIAFRRGDNLWNARFRLAMGDHPDFDVVTQVISHPLANDTFYVMAEPAPLDLTPMVVMRYCDQCRQPEVCHADRVDERAGVSLKSFARGHQVFDRELLDEVNSLIPSGSPGKADGA